MHHAAKIISLVLFLMVRDGTMRRVNHVPREIQWGMRGQLTFRMKFAYFATGTITR